MFFDTTFDDIIISATSPVTITDLDPTVNNDGGNIVFAAEGNADGDDLTINADITVTNGDAALDGDGNIILIAGDSVITRASPARVISTDNAGQVFLLAGTDFNNIWITASSPVIVDAGNPVVDNDGGHVVLAAESTGAGDDLTLYDNVRVTGGDGAIDGDGNIDLYAGDTIDLAAATVVVSVDASGTVLLSAGSDYNNNAPQDGNSGGDVSMASGSAVSSEDGNITLLAPNNVQLSLVNADSDGDLAAGDVIVTADYAGPNPAGLSNNVGAISDSLTGTASNGEAPNIVGDQVALRAGSGIGSGVAGDVNDIDTAVRTLAAGTGTVTFSLTDCDGKVDGNVTAGNIVMGLDAQAPEGALRRGKTHRSDREGPGARTAPAGLGGSRRGPDQDGQPEWRLFFSQDRPVAVEDDRFHIGCRTGLENLRANRRRDEFCI